MLCPHHDCWTKVTNATWHGTHNVVSCLCFNSRVFAHSLFSQSVARGGISLSAILDYTLTPELSTKACFINYIRVRNCIGVYHQWSNNRISIDVWYQLRKIKWCRKWGVKYVSYYNQMGKIFFIVYMTPHEQPIGCSFSDIIRDCAHTGSRFWNIK